MKSTFVYNYNLAERNEDVNLHIHQDPMGHWAAG